MGLFEILLIIACSLIVVGVIVKSVIDRKNGKNSCGCDCSSCSGSCSCKTRKHNSETQTK